MVASCTDKILTPQVLLHMVFLVERDNCIWTDL